MTEETKSEVQEVSNKKGVAEALRRMVIFAGIAAVGLGLLFLIVVGIRELTEPRYPTKLKLPPDTGKWLTYRNEEYGLEFSYPNIFEFNEDSRNGSLRICMTVSSIQKYCNKPNISFDTRRDTIEISITDEDTSVWRNGSTYKNGSDILVDSVPAKISRYNLPSDPLDNLGPKNQSIIILFPQRRYFIRVRTKNFNSEYFQYFDKIVASFNFIDRQDSE